jgi:hypothetical protein
MFFSAYFLLASYFAISLHVKSQSTLSDGKLNSAKGYLRNLYSPRLVAVSVGIAAFFPKPSFADEKSSFSIYEGLFVDSKNGFTTVIPPEWIINANKFPVPDLNGYGKEQILLSATSVTHGTSMSVTKTDASRLLEDFGVEWWFVPLKAVEDLGDPKLIAELLILQRQGEFEKKRTSSEIVTAKANTTLSSISFEFLTPIGSGVERKTAAKVILNDGYLFTIWLSGRQTTFESDYVETLENMLNRFSILKLQPTG